MRVTIIKTLNLIGVIGLLLVYQLAAGKREQEKLAYESEVAKAQEAWSRLEQAQERTDYADGTYQGIGRGYGGEVKVEVKIQDGKIKNVKLISAENETEEYLNAALAILDKAEDRSCENLQLDAISGATLSSNGIIDGIREAVTDAYED